MQLLEIPKQVWFTVMEHLGAHEENVERRANHIEGENKIGVSWMVGRLFAFPEVQGSLEKLVWSRPR